MKSAEDAMELSQPRASTASIIEDGFFAGMIGALMVAVWFLILDAIAGHPLYTPSLLGSVLLHGVDPSQYNLVEPQPVAVYTVIHFAACILVGVLASYLTSLFERFTAVGIAIVFLAVFFEVGFFVIDLALGGHLVGRLHAWAVGVANILATLGMAFYLWTRHPGLARSFQRVNEE